MTLCKRNGKKPKNVPNCKILFHLIFSACNIITRAQAGVYTLRNYGKRINCSMSILSPQFVQVLTMNVCVTRRTSSAQHIAETGYFEEVMFAAYLRKYIKLLSHLNFSARYQFTVKI